MVVNKKRLSELCNVQIGRTPPRKEQEWFNTKFPSDLKWCSIKDLGECSKYISNTTETISEKGYKRFNIPLVKKGTVLLSFKLTVGRVAITNCDMLTNEAIAQLPIKNKLELDTDYLYYYLKIYPWSTLGSTSSIATAVNSKMIKDMVISYPPLYVQKKIASILNAIDDKIEANNRMNIILEKMVDALYLELVANSDNNSALGNICDILSGKRPEVRSETISADTPYELIGAASIMGYTNNYNFDKRILVTGRVGTHGVIQRFNKKCWASDNTLVITSKYYEFVSQILKRIDYRALNRGSTQPLITQGDLKKVCIYIPEEELLLDFENKAGELMGIFEKNRDENKRLAELRDTLLPKLMSGEIDVDAIEL